MSEGDSGCSFPVFKAEGEWKQVLTAEQFHVMRRHGTEMAGTSPLNYEKRTGQYHCAGCGQTLFNSATKYESGSGWPSFWDVVPGAVATSTDHKLIYPRTEVHCSGCGAHLGHLFDDGPQPTGQRYCMNGVALSFAPQQDGNEK